MKKKMFVLSLFCIMSVLYSVDFEGYYKSFSGEYEPKAISIEKKSSTEYEVEFLMTHEREKHIATLIGEQLQIIISENLKLRFKINDNELRMFMIKGQGYVPEDIEFSFFKTKR